jgi:hypothetical protein
MRIIYEKKESVVETYHTSDEELLYEDNLCTNVHNIEDLTEQQNYLCYFKNNQRINLERKVYE